MLPQLHQGSSHFEIRTFNIILNHKSKPQLLEDPDESLSLILQHDHVLTGLFFSLLVASISLLPPVSDRFGSWQISCLFPGAGWLVRDRQRGIDYTESVGKRGLCSRTHAGSVASLQESSPLWPASLQVFAYRRISELCITLGGSYSVMEGADCGFQRAAS